MNKQKEQPVLHTEMIISDCKIKLNFLSKPNEKTIQNIKKILLDNISVATTAVG